MRPPSLLARLSQPIKPLPPARAELWHSHGRQQFNCLPWARWSLGAVSTRGHSLKCSCYFLQNADPPFKFCCIPQGKLLQNFTACWLAGSNGAALPRKHSLRGLTCSDPWTNQQELLSMAQCSVWLPAWLLFSPSLVLVFCSHLPKQETAPSCSATAAGF